MNTVVRLTVALAAGFLGGLLANQVKSRKELPPEEIRDHGLLLADASHIPARHTLTRLQERPVFATDEKLQPYAMLHDMDTDTSGRGGDKPSILQEPQADSSS